MKSRKVFDDVLARYNEEQQTSIRLEEDLLGEFTPTTDLVSQTVTLNPHLEMLFTLFNLCTVNKAIGSKAIHHFLLYHLAMRKNMYGKSEELLNLLHDDINRLMATKGENRLPFTDLLMECQIIFLLMHEASHIYYYRHPEALAANRKGMKHDLQWLRRELDTDRPILVRLMQGLIPGLRNKMEHSFDEAIADQDLQEELLCDDAAWRITFNLMKRNVPDSELQAILAAYIVYTLYYIEAQRTLENIYMTDDNQVRQQHLMFDTTRSTMLVNLVWDFIDPACIGTFKSLVNAISRTDRLFLMLPLRANMEHIAYIRHGQREKYSLKENLRMTELYNETIGNALTHHWNQQ